MAGPLPLHQLCCCSLFCWVSFIQLASCSQVIDKPLQRQEQNITPSGHWFEWYLLARIGTWKHSRRCTDDRNKCSTKTPTCLKYLQIPESFYPLLESLMHPFNNTYDTDLYQRSKMTTIRAQIEFHIKSYWIDVMIQNRWFTRLYM